MGVFEIDVDGGGGCYTRDPLESCLPCNYFRSPGEGEKFSPAQQCMCPADMTKGESRRLKKEYSALIDEGSVDKTKEGFWEFVKRNH